MHATENGGGLNNVKKQENATHSLAFIAISSLLQNFPSNKISISLLEYKVDFVKTTMF